MNYIVKNWKTSLIGLVAIATTVVETWFPEYKGILIQVTTILIGTGLIVAKDGNKSGS